MICSLFAADFFSGEKHSGVVYTIGKNEYTLSAKEAYDGDTLLVCFDDIAALCEMSETGSAESRTFFAANSEQSIAIEAGSQIALLNGSKVDMLSAAKLRDGKLYVPLAFVERYMSGIVVSRGTDNGDVQVLRGEYNASTKNNPLYQDTAFTGTAEVPLELPEALENVAPTYSFMTDLSAYAEYMCPERGICSRQSRGDHRCAQGRTHGAHGRDCRKGTAGALYRDACRGLYRCFGYERLPLL